MKLTRHKLRGNYTWCLNWRNGWIRIYNVMVRWNTDWAVSHTYFGITNMKESK